MSKSSPKTFHIRWKDAYYAYVIDCTSTLPLPPELMQRAPGAPPSALVLRRGRRQDRRQLGQGEAGVAERDLVALQTCREARF